MKIGLVYAGITTCGFNSLKGIDGVSINHGLAILSSAAKRVGHEVELFDLRRMTGWDDFKAQASKSSPRVFGFTMMSLDFDVVVKAATIIKEILPSSVTVVGGPHPSICPEELEQLACFDHIFKGEGELTFPALLKSIEDGSPMPHVIQGQPLENLDDAPWADREIFSSGLEAPFLPELPRPFVSVIAGRGCKYNCRFCQPAERIIFGPKVRRRSVANVISELKCLQDKYHYNSFVIHDDCITEDRAWVMEFCERLKKEGLVRPFIAQSRADIICHNPDMVKLMHDAGLSIMIVGFESGSDRILKFLRKGCTRAQNIEAATILRENGIKIWANYMIGLPTETKAEVWETYSMLKEIRPFHCSVAFYTPHPGSELFNYGKKQGLHLMVSHESYRRNSFVPKIKGPDYDFLTDMLYLSIFIAENAPPQGLGYHIRHWLIMHAPAVYHWLRNCHHHIFSRAS